MPPRTPQRRPIQRTKGSDPTVSIASAATARNAMNTQEAENKQVQEASKENPNDDLKKLIESLKNKLGNNSTAASQKKLLQYKKQKAPGVEVFQEKKKKQTGHQNQPIQYLQEFQTMKKYLLQKKHLN